MSHIRDTAWIGHPMSPIVKKHQDARYCGTYPCRCRIKSRW